MKNKLRFGLSSEEDEKRGPQSVIYTLLWAPPIHVLSSIWPRFQRRDKPAYFSPSASPSVSALRRSMDSSFSRWRFAESLATIFSMIGLPPRRFSSASSLRLILTSSYKNEHSTCAAPLKVSLTAWFDSSTDSVVCVKYYQRSLREVL